MQHGDEGSAWEELPAAWRESLKRGLIARDLELSDLRWFGSGRSGAPVGRVDLYVAAEGNYIGEVVMKFVARAGLADPTAPYRRIFQEAPESFRRAHLTELVDGIGPIQLPEHDVIFQRLAGRDMSLAVPLGETVRDPGFAALCGRITASLVADWNVTVPGRPKPDTVGGFLDRHLHDRQRMLLSWAADRHMSPDVPRLADGRANPFALFDPPLAGRSLQRVFLGYAHGDISLRNIIRVAEPEEYLLIDYDRYKKDAPLTRDPVHLIISMAAERLGAYQAGDPVREDLIRVIVDPDVVGPPEVAGFAAISRAVRDGPAEWALGKGGYTQWREQTLLSMVGCALRALSRQPDGQDPVAYREWCLSLAAAATEQFLGLPTTRASTEARTRAPWAGVTGPADAPATNTTPTNTTPMDADPSPVRVAGDAPDARTLLRRVATTIDGLSPYLPDDGRQRICDDATADMARIGELLRGLSVPPRNQWRLDAAMTLLPEVVATLADLRRTGSVPVTDRAFAQVNDLLDVISPVLS